MKRITRGLLLTFFAVSTVAACSSDDSGDEDGPSGAGGSSTGGAAATADGGSNTTDGGNLATGGAARGTGGAPSSGGAASSGGNTGACLPRLAHCDGSSPCCPDSVCLADDAGDRRCRQTCAKNEDCASACCAADAASGSKVCADASACPVTDCRARGVACSAPGETCCSGLVCVAWNDPPRSACEQECKTAGDCPSGCCTPLANAKTSFCAEPEACQCAALDATCGGSAHCCAGLACTTFDATGAFACKPTCKTNDECVTKCCAPLAGTGDSVCLGKDWCR